MNRIPLFLLVFMPAAVAAARGRQFVVLSVSR